MKKLIALLALALTACSGGYYGPAQPGDVEEADKLCAAHGGYKSVGSHRSSYSNGRIRTELSIVCYDELYVESTRTTRNK